MSVTGGEGGNKGGPPFPEEESGGDTDTTSTSSTSERDISVKGSSSTTTSLSSEKPSVKRGGGEGGENPFSDYLWMENMEEFDQEILRQLEEEILISHYTDLYEDSLLEDGSAGPTTASLCVMNTPIIPPLALGVGASPSGELDAVAQQFTQSLNLSSTSANSRLNPNAAEFVPKSYGPSSTLKQ